MDKKQIIDIIFNTFDQLMAQSDNLVIEKSIDSQLSAEGSALDSLGLVNFLLALENNLNAKLDTPISVMNQDLIISEDQPLRTVDTLSSYIANKLSS